jgi:hypothetical protein
MKRFLHWLAHEMREAAPAALWFFVSFQLIALTDALMLEQYGIRASAFLMATVAALVAAKVVLIVDLLPFANRFAQAPLAASIAWKSFLILLVAGTFKYLEHLLPLLYHHHDPLLANRELLTSIGWHRFWAIVIWLVVLSSGFCTLRELGRVLGRERLRQIFFGNYPHEPR